MEPRIKKADTEQDRSAWPSVTEGQVLAYVDGSFRPEPPRYAYACVLFTSENGAPACYELSGYGHEAETLEIRNVAGEMLASMHAVVWAMKRGARQIEIRYDYSGIEMWAEGRWKAKHPLTKKYAEAMNRWRTRIEIRFSKVEAHSGDRWNNAADRLAKGALLYDTDEEAH